MHNALQKLSLWGMKSTLEFFKYTFSYRGQAIMTIVYNTLFVIFNLISMMLFIPFLIIDLVVASVLMSMGMMMLSPLIISLPFKLMIFVLADGWSMVAGTLSASFGAAP